MAEDDVSQDEKVRTHTVVEEKVATPAGTDTVVREAKVEKGHWYRRRPTVGNARDAFAVLAILILVILAWGVLFPNGAIARFDRRMLGRLIRPAPVRAEVVDVTPARVTGPAQPAAPAAQTTTTVTTPTAAQPSSVVVQSTGSATTVVNSTPSQTTVTTTARAAAARSAQRARRPVSSRPLNRLRTDVRPLDP